MGFNCGIVGLPNVGKSTLFNAITSTAAAAAANYPFCTIEPNLGRVPVPDPRLEVVAKIARSAEIVPTQLEIVDIAGLVRGASRGEGLGNRFLGAIREVDAILHVLRCFESADVAHVEGTIDPSRDAELVETELLLADLGALERRVEGLTKRARGGDELARDQLAADRADPAGDAAGHARARAPPRARGPAAAPDAPAPERQAHALRLQRRRGGRRQRQRRQRPGRRPRRQGRRRRGRGRGRDRGRARRACRRPSAPSTSRPSASSAAASIG